MRLLKLRFQNINSLAGEFEIDFTDPVYAESGIFAIVGPTGSGKSSILDALTLALYGTTPRLEDMPSEAAKGEDCPFMTKGRRSCFAEAVFEADGGVWLSRWRASYGATGRAKKLVKATELVRLASAADQKGEVAATKMSEWSAKIERLTGMNRDAFLRCVLLAQGAFASLLRAPINERALLLERITGTEIYTEISRQVHEHAAAAKAETERLRLRMQSDLPMSGEARAQKEKALELARQDVQANESARESLSAARVIAERYLLAQKRKVDAEGKRRTKAEALAASEVRQVKLETARRAAAPAREYEAYVELQKRSAAKTQLFAAAEEALAAAERRAQAAEEAASGADGVAKLAEAALAAFRPVYEAATSADLELAELAKRSAEAKAADDQARRSLRRLADEARAAELASKAAEVALSLAEAEAKAREGDVHLAGALPAAETFAAQITAAGEQRRKVLSTLRAAQAAAQDAQTRAQSAEEGQKTAKTALASASAALQEANRALEAAGAESSIEEAVVRMRQAADHWWSAKWALALLEDIRHAKAAAELAAKTSNDELRRFAESVIARAVENGRQLSAQYPDIARGLNPARIRELEAAMQTIRRRSEALGTAQNRAAAAAKAHAAAQEAFQAAQAVAAQAAMTKLEAAKALEAKQAEALANAQTYEAAKASYLKNLSVFFAPGDDAWRRSPASETLAALRDRAERCRQAVERLAQAKARSEEVRRKEAAALASLAQAKHRGEETKDAAAAAAAALQKAQLDRRAAWGDLVPKQKLGALEDDCRGKQRAQAAAVERSAKAASERAGAASAKKAALEALEEARAAEARARGTAQQSMAQAGFDTPAALLAAVMPAPAIEALAQEIERIKSEAAAAQGAYDGACEQLAEAERTALADPIAAKTPLFEIDARLAAASEGVKRAQTELGALQEALEADDRKRAAASQWADALAEAEIKRERWERLHAMIGGFDGKKFRLAAQRLTFRMLLTNANLVLRSMDSRYELSPAGETGLDVAVIDKNMLGVVRTSFNLSGGETFLASLALALALSRMSSKKLSIGTLFLDEGFGSLDADTLEKALAVLEGLQQGERKLIGLISHVRAVRERIDAHITVRPKAGTGESTISGPGVRVF